jgi:hypothetical protein
MCSLCRENRAIWATLASPADRFLVTPVGFSLSQVRSGSSVDARWLVACSSAPPVSRGCFGSAVEEGGNGGN